LSFRLQLDGRDITTLDPSWVHRYAQLLQRDISWLNVLLMVAYVLSINRQVGLVSQEPVLFADTIKSNLTYGVEHATDDQIKVRVPPLCYIDCPGH
jgi:hypothetical protein